MTDDTRAAAYDMGRRHGYELATAELLRIMRDQMKAGVDIGPLLSLVDDLRKRSTVALAEPSTGGTS